MDTKNIRASDRFDVVVWGIFDECGVIGAGQL